jgi:FKBP-type peptidyl-prolyl cis-trans isomerase SlyD
MRAQVISFHCIMKNKVGQVLSSSFVRDAINQRNIGRDRLPGLVDGLQSVQAGEKRSIAVPASNAYGPYDPGLLVELRRADLEYGDQLTYGSQILRSHGHPSGERASERTEDRVFRVIRIDDESVTLDGNHPLAGHDLVFEVEIVSAREAHEDDFLDTTALIRSPLLH